MSAIAATSPKFTLNINSSRAGFIVDPAHPAGKLEAKMPDGSMMNPAEQIEENGASTEAPQVEKTPRDQSTIQFPYMDLEDGITVARVLHNNGGVPCARDQLAAAMNQRTSSGSFGLKVGAARMFGLLETVQNKYQLTQLGFSILDSDEKRQRAAKVEAFLNIPLYRRTHEEFRNRLLPPRPLGLEQAFVEFGVAPKQKTNARYAFDRSARQAGFFEHGEDKLVAPVVGYSQKPPSAPRSAEESPSADEPKSAQVTPLSSAEHPFIKGLLLSLPEKIGVDWSLGERVDWLQAAAKVFDLMFKGGGPITISEDAQPLPRAKRKSRDDPSGSPE